MNEHSDKKYPNLQTIEGIEPVSQRINFLIQALEKGIRRRFAIRIGVPPSRISEILGGRKTRPSAEILEMIAAAYPQVRTSWLVRGEGNMLESENPDPSQNNLSYAGHSNAHAVGLLSDIPVIELGRVSFSARASFNYTQLQRFMSSDLFDKVLFRLPPNRCAEDYKDALVFDIAGDSMEPSLHDGQQVIAWPVPEGKWEHLHNAICVVDYDDTVTVKAIFKNDLFATNGLVLHATGGRGGEFTVGRSLIHSIWEVREFYGVVPVRLVA